MLDMLVRLYDLPEIKPLLKGINTLGITIRNPMAHERFEVVHWVMESFGKRWAGECEAAFSRNPVSCFIAVREGAVIGFACHDCTCKNFFGPMGVARDHRAKGVGKALLVSCLKAMKSMGYGYAVIGGTSMHEFYEHAVNASVIQNSSPGIYPQPLKKS